jgi:hypothetical protein
MWGKDTKRELGQGHEKTIMQDKIILRKELGKIRYAGRGLDKL